MENVKLTQNDYNNISNISANHNLDYALIEKLYVEMLEKAKKQMLFKVNLKALIEKIKANK